MNGPKKLDEAYVVKDGRRYAQQPVKSALPIWIAAAVWVLAALFCPMYRWWHYLLIALVSAIAGGEAASLLPKEKKLVPVPWTSDADLNDAAQAMTEYAEKFRASASRLRVRKPQLAAQVVSIADTTEKIRDAVLDQPEDFKRLRRFMTYYLPTVQKLTERAAFLTGQNATGANIAETEKAISDAIAQTDASFKLQLDALFSDDALDLTTDQQVLDTLLAKDALK